MDACSVPDARPRVPLLPKRVQKHKKLKELKPGKRLKQRQNEPERLKQE